MATQGVPIVGTHDGYVRDAGIFNVVYFSEPWACGISYVVNLAPYTPRGNPQFPKVIHIQFWYIGNQTPDVSTHRHVMLRAAVFVFFVITTFYLPGVWNGRGLIFRRVLVTSSYHTYFKSSCFAHCAIYNIFTGHLVIRIGEHRVAAGRVRYSIDFPLVLAP